MSHTASARVDGFERACVPPGLSEVIAALEAAFADARRDDIDAGLDALENAVHDGGLEHVRLVEAGRLALKGKRWDLAERLAIRALLAYPKYGLAYMVLSDASYGLGRDEEGALCRRYELPSAIKDRHFGESSCVLVDSTLSDAAGIERHVAYPSERHALRQPFQLESVPVADLDHEEIVSAEAYVSMIPGGRLWYDGGNAIAWDRKGRVVEDLGMGYAPLVHESVQRKTPVKVPGRVCLLGNRSYINYYHWMCDSLPRLEVLRAAGIDPDSIDRFVVMPPKHAFHGDTLRLLGIGEDRLHTAADGEYIVADELFMPVFGSNSLGLAQGGWGVRFLEHAFGPRSIERSGRRLFVSRGTIGKRGIVNEPELMRTLEPMGFELVRCETLDVTEQAVLFAEASVVLGPHGAGLTNIAFCRPGTVVIELFNAHMAACFWTISELKGLRHALHFSGHIDESTGAPGSNPERTVSAIEVRLNPFTVDTEKLLETLAALDVR